VSNSGNHVGNEFMAEQHNNTLTNPGAPVSLTGGRKLTMAVSGALQTTIQVSNSGAALTAFQVWAYPRKDAPGRLMLSTSAQFAAPDGQFLLGCSTAVAGSAPSGTDPTSLASGSDALLKLNVAGFQALELMGNTAGTTVVTVNAGGN
jgi:hypothetical protein